MNLARFQLALNHDDPSIVVTGLKEFKDRIILDHSTLLSFGYNGRSFTEPGILVKQPQHVTGLLKDYIHSSPQLEELFILWKISGREENTDLLIAHNQCWSAILHCAISETKCCSDAVTRLLSECWRSIINQLSMSSTAVVHSSLGLLISMCRTSTQNCCDTYTKLISHATELHSLLQRGKSVSYELDSIKISTDSRYLVALLVYTVIWKSDAVGLELVGHRGLLSRVTNGIQKDHIVMVMLTCKSIYQLLVCDSVPVVVKVELVSGSFLEKLLELSNSEMTSEHDELAECLDLILKAYTDALIHASGGKKSVGASVHGHMAVLIKVLSPQSDMSHRELICSVLRARPHMLSRCLQAVPVQWDQPTVSLPFITAIDYICHLLKTVDIESGVKEAGRALNACDVAYTETEKYPNIFMRDQLVVDTVASGASKRDITKMLQHKSPLVQRMGILLYLRIVQRIERCIREVKQSHVSKLLQSHLVGSLLGSLPDVQVLFSLRNRYFKTFIDAVTAAGPAANKSEHISNGDDAEEEEDTQGLAYETGSLNDDALGEESGSSSTSIQQSLYFTQLILIILETILKTCPLLMCSQNSFDITRLLDEVIPWAMDQSPAGAAARMYTLVSEQSQEHYGEVLLSTLRLLTLATSQGHCRWFGTRPDCVKAIAAAVVSRQWEVSSKRSPLSKLILLSTLARRDTENPESVVSHVVESSDKLLESVMVQSEMFCGHGVTDNELLVERSSWITALKVSRESHCVLLFDMLMRTSHHWNVDICLSANELVQSCHSFSSSSSSDNKDYIQLKAVPYSPLIFSALSLGSANLSLVHSLLPKHIQTRYDGLNSSSTSEEHAESVQFFAKFSQTFCKEMELMLSQVILLALPWYSSPTSFLDVLVQTAKHLDSVASLSGGSMVELASKIRALLQKVPSGASKSIKKSRRTRSSSMTDIDNPNFSLYDMAGTARSYSDGSSMNHLNVEDIAKCVVDGATMPHIETAWAVVLESTLQSGAASIRLELLEWIGKILDNESVSITTSSFEHKIAMTIYAVRMIQHLASIVECADTGVTLSTHATLRGKKRTKDAVSEESEIDGVLKQQLEDLIRTFTMIVVECIRSTGFAPQIAAALNVPCVIQSFPDGSLMGRSFLEILFAAVVSQYRQMQTHSKKKIEIQTGTSSLWSSVCSKLSEIDFTSAVEGDKALFALCWSIQMVHDDSHLRRVFVSYALEEDSVESLGGGFQLTSLAQAQCYHLVDDRKMVNVKRGMLSYGLDPIHTSLLNAASVEALEKAVDGLLEAYIKGANKEVLLNALCGTVVNTENVSDGRISLSIPDYYCEVLSLVRVSELKTDNFAKRKLLSSLSCNFNTLQIQSLDKGKTKQRSVKESKIISSADAFALSSACIPFLSQEGLSLVDIADSLLVTWNMTAHSDGLIDIFTEKMRLMMKILPADASSAVADLCVVLMRIKNVSSSPLCENILILLQSHTNAIDCLTVVLPCIIHCVLVLVNFSDTNSTIQNLLSLLQHTLQFLVDKAVALMKNNDSSHTLRNLFNAIHFILSMKLHCGSSLEEPWPSCCEKVASLCNKLVKSCLKYGLGNAAALRMLENLMELDNTSMSRLAALEEVEQGSVIDYSLVLSKRNSQVAEKFSLIHCTTILEMLVSHSKFEKTVDGNTELLRTVLLLVSLAYSHIQNHDSDLSRECLTFLAQCLLRQYTGGMGLGDRIIMRVLYLTQKILDKLHENSGDEDSAALNRSIFTYPPTMLAKHASSSTWILTAMTPPMVYATLAAFPTWRSLKPQPLEFEYETALHEHITCIRNDTEALLDHVSTVSSQQEEEKSNKITALSKQLTTISESNPEEDSEDEWDTAQHSTTRCVDMLHDLSGNVLDPSYWLPCIHLALAKNEDLSMRQFASCGALAFVIACLSSDCVFVRSYAKACLQLVLVFLRKQTPDKDSAFRERPQLLVVVNFIRNAFDNDKKGQFVQNHLPLTSGIFLGRAALHLLQPQHSLFSSMNKYLLSRPYCDRKDIPLYESLVVEGDVDNDAVTRLAALRLLRDCIGSKEDHLNMCRKNAYSRLMVYFVLFGKDAKSAHAILDILDRALSFSAGARYLLERCALIPWLQQLVSPVNSSRTSLHQSDETIGARADDNDMPLQAAPTRMLFRVMALLRKTVAALSLLEGEGIEIVAYLQHAFIAVNSTIREILALSRTDRVSESVVPFEFFKQLVLCMWDISVAVSTVDRSDLRLTGLQWASGDLLALSQSILQLYQCNTQLTVESEKLALCVITMLSFARKEGNALAMSSSNAQAVLDISIGTSTKHLFQSLHNAKKSLDSQPLCVISSAELGGSDSESVTFLQSDQKAIYFSGLNISYQDLLMYKMQSPDVSKHSCGHSMMIIRNDGPFNIEEGVFNILQNNWSVLSSVQFSSTPLPFDLGAPFMLGLVFKTVIFGLQSLLSQQISPISSALSTARWALVMKKCHLDASVLDGVRIRSAPSAVYAVTARIASIIDVGNVSNYTPGYMFFQKMQDAALICALSLKYLLEACQHLKREGGSVAAIVLDLFTRTAAIICVGSSDALNNKALSVAISTRSLFAQAVWTSVNTRCRVVALAVMEKCCGLSSQLLTLHDRSHGDNADGSLFVDAMNLTRMSASSHPSVSALIAQCDALEFVLTEFADLSSKCTLIGQHKNFSDMQEEPITVSDRTGMWSDSHYLTKSNRTLGAYLLYENMDYGSSSGSIGGSSYRPVTAKSDTSMNLLLRAMKQAANDSSLLGDAENWSLSKSDDKPDVYSDCNSDNRGISEEVFITKKRPRFHKLTFTPHFSRQRKTKYFCRAIEE